MSTKLRDLRILGEPALALKELAKQLGISTSRLKYYEKQDSQPPKEILEKLVGIYGQAKVNQLEFSHEYRPITNYNKRQPNRSPKDSFGAKLRLLRLEKGLKQYEFAALMHLPEQHYAMVERGRVKPSEIFLNRLATILVEPEKMFTFTEALEDKNKCSK